MLAGASDLDIDEDRIGMSGHSFGGWTTLKTVEKDTRIKAMCLWHRLVVVRQMKKLFGLFALF